MNHLMSFLKSLRIVQVLTVAVASVILFFGTACNSPTLQAKTLDNTKPSPEEYVPENAVKSPYEGGMNQYSDVDPRSDTSAADAKADYLVKNAERNLDKMVDSPEQYARNYRSGTPLGERIERIGENVGSSAKETAAGVAKGTQRGVENVKENTKNAAKDTAENVKQNTQDTADKLSAKSQRAAADASDFIKDKSHDAIKRAERATDKAEAATR
jgi:ElaB/YqjD/DUF883 family membrane-anchored ribosome-binding protein